MVNHKFAKHADIAARRLRYFNFLYVVSLCGFSYMHYSQSYGASDSNE